MLSPSLVDYELAKLALKKVRRRPAEAPRIAVALHAARALPIRRVAVPGFEAFALARQTGLTAYDAAYLWLSRAYDAELVTLDTALNRHAGR
jgi:predicted nucleic acid-binding protein